MKWEYKLVRLEMMPDSSRHEMMLNELGAEGWELVAAVSQPGRVVFLKRQLTGPTEVTA